MFCHPGDGFFWLWSWRPYCGCPWLEYIDGVVPSTANTTNVLPPPPNVPLWTSVDHAYPTRSSRVAIVPQSNGACVGVTLRRVVDCPSAFCRRRLSCDSWGKNWTPHLAQPHLSPFVARPSILPWTRRQSMVVNYHDRMTRCVRCDPHRPTGCVHWHARLPVLVPTSIPGLPIVALPPRWESTFRAFRRVASLCWFRGGLLLVLSVVFFEPLVRPVAVVSVVRHDPDSTGYGPLVNVPQSHVPRQISWRNVRHTRDKWSIPRRNLVPLGSTTRWPNDSRNPRLDDVVVVDPDDCRHCCCRC
mmetsp:Transcript_1883/g.3977  ORF Transcript_1883/g.3977 Transcript_1883/m.3977 type:complete len:301 (+) Transcript_1883:138-1040(+)